MIRMIRRLLAFVFLLVGIAIALASGFALFWSDELQQLYLPSLPVVGREADPRIRVPAARVEKGQPIGMLEIPRLGLSSVVLEGDDVAALLFGVGHLSDTPLPWHGGNSAFAAHRDTFFRPLAGIRRNDVIRFSTTDAKYEYVVTEMKVVKATDVDVLDPTRSPTLTLITCFPFDYVGPAPDRFVVRAERRS
jgi:sortase A